MRRGIAIILTLLFGSLFVLPLLAASPDDSAIPQCCRKNGKHKCQMTTPRKAVVNQGVGQGVDPGFYAVGSKCPCYPQATIASQLQLFKAATPRTALFADLVVYPTMAAQAEASFRVSYDRSRQKRGPPSLILS